MEFVIKALCSKHLGLSLYKKEYLPILMVVDKRRHYLEHDQFLIKIDSESLKYLLDQKIYSLMQKERIDRVIKTTVLDSLQKGKRE